MQPPKFKVGDKVKMIPPSKIGEEHPKALYEALHYHPRTMIVTEIIETARRGYVYKIKGMATTYAEYCLEPAGHI